MIMRSVVRVAIFLLLSSTFLDAAPANTVIATMNVGVTPAGIAITPNNKTLLALRSGGISDEIRSCFS